MLLGFNIILGKYFTVSLLICVFGACPQHLSSTLFWLFAQAEAIHVNPLYILLPSTLCTSFAFLLPVANPPNAIVFSYGHLKVIDMVSQQLKEHTTIQYASICDGPNRCYPLTPVHHWENQSLKSVSKTVCMAGPRIVFKKQTCQMWTYPQNYGHKQRCEKHEHWPGGKEKCTEFLILTP